MNPSKRPDAECSTGELLKIIADSARDHPFEDDPQRVAAWNEIKRRTDEVERLQRLLIEHHAVGAFDKTLVGDFCPICRPVDE